MIFWDEIHEKTQTIFASDSHGINETSKKERDTKWLNYWTKFIDFDSFEVAIVNNLNGPGRRLSQTFWSEPRTFGLSILVLRLQYSTCKWASPS